MRSTSIYFGVSCFQTDYVAFCRLAKQPSKCDDRGHAGAVEEQDGGQTLQTEGVSDVAPVKRQLPLDVQDQTSTYPGTGQVCLDFQERVHNEIKYHQLMDKLDNNINIILTLTQLTQTFE